MSLEEIRLEGNSIESVPTELLTKGTMPLLEHLYTKLNESQDIFRYEIYNCIYTRPCRYCIFTIVLMLG